jgi:hypothetical protein
MAANSAAEMLERIRIAEFCNKINKYIIHSILIIHLSETSYYDFDFSW